MDVLELKNATIEMKNPVEDSKVVMNNNNKKSDQ